MDVQEMTVITLLLLGQSITAKTRADTIDVYLESACYSYVTRCSSFYAALRCILVAVELLRISGGSSAELAAKWANRALELKPKYDVGRAMITQRVGECYSVKKGAGSGSWGGRRRKAAMWHILAAETWIVLQKYTQARQCIDIAMSIYDKTTFNDISRFITQLKLDSGYTTLLNLEDEGDGNNDLDEESETLQMGKRKSMIVASKPDADAQGGENWAENEFTTSDDRA